MQKAPVMKGSGLIPLDDAPRPNEAVHVFGKNLEERVVTNDDDDDESPSISFSTSQSNRNEAEDDIETIRKRKFDAITGEEDEKTIFQGDFKLFVWDLKTSNWIERGRGQLKLNDSIDDSDKSRLILRVSGTHKIVLNVAVNHSFFRVIASSKMNIRFTDGQTVWAASGSNAHHLKELLEPRLKRSPAHCDLERKRTKPEIEEEDNAPSKKTKADLEDEKLGPKNTDQNDESERKEEEKNSEIHHSNDAGDHEGEDETELLDEKKSEDKTEAEEKEAGGEEGGDGEKEDTNKHGNEETEEEPATADNSEKSDDHDNSNEINQSKELPQQEQGEEVLDYHEKDNVDEVESSRGENSK